MRRFLWIIVVIFSSLYLICTTKDGEIASFKPSFGSIFVSSTVPDARIFLDYRDTGLTTPALVSDVRVGHHIVHIFLSRYEPDVDSMIVEVEEGKETSINFELINVPTVGNLRVVTDPDSALVLIDKLIFGYTPLNITGLLAGQYKIRVIKSGFDIIEKNIQITQNQTTEISENLSSLRHVVLFEHYSNTDCQPCVQVDIIVENVIEQLGPAEVVSLGYHPNIPSPNDPFYLAAKPENNARKNYYSVPYSPYALVDGVKKINTLSIGQLEQNILTAIDERQQSQPKVILEIFDFQTNVDTVSGRVKISALDNLGADLVLRVALINRSVNTNDPPGTNGQTHFFDVMRDFLQPAAEGIPISLSGGEIESVPFRFVREGDWGYDLEVIAFLQNNASKEVLQSAWTVLP